MKEDDRRTRERERTGASSDTTAAKALAANIMALIALTWFFDADDRGSES